MLRNITYLRTFTVKKTPRFATLAIAALLPIYLMGCTPKIGSEKWCANLKERPQGDWSMNETVAYTKHCILK